MKTLVLLLCLFLALPVSVFGKWRPIHNQYLSEQLTKPFDMCEELQKHYDLKESKITIDSLQKQQQLNNIEALLMIIILQQKQRNGVEK